MNWNNLYFLQEARRTVILPKCVSQFSALSGDMMYLVELKSSVWVTTRPMQSLLLLYIVD